MVSCAADVFNALSAILVSRLQRCGPASNPGTRRQTKLDANAGRWPFPVHDKQRQYDISVLAHTHTNFQKLFKSRRPVAPGGGWVCALSAARVCIYITRSVFDRQRPFSHYHFNGINRRANTHTHTHKLTDAVLNKLIAITLFYGNTYVSGVRARVCVCVTSILARWSLYYTSPAEPPSVFSRTLLKSVHGPLGQFKKFSKWNGLPASPPPPPPPPTLPPPPPPPPPPPHPTLP